MPKMKANVLPVDKMAMGYPFISEVLAISPVRYQAIYQHFVVDELPHIVPTVT